MCVGGLKFVILVLILRPADANHRAIEKETRPKLVELEVCAYPGRSSVLIFSVKHSCRNLSDSPVHQKAGLDRLEQPLKIARTLIIALNSLVAWQKVCTVAVKLVQPHRTCSHFSMELQSSSLGFPLIDQHKVKCNIKVGKKI